MTKDYVIGWKCQINGRIGRGKTLMALEDAQSLADKLNKSHAGYEHVPVRAEAEFEDLPRLFSKDAATAELPEELRGLAPTPVQ
jgi:hypothetical protein